VNVVFVIREELILVLIIKLLIPSAERPYDMYTASIYNLVVSVNIVMYIPIARQRRRKQALSTIQAVFSIGSVQSGCKRVEFRSWQFSWVELSVQMWGVNGSLRISIAKIRYQETSGENIAEE
jgi:hypothetical protein